MKFNRVTLQLLCFSLVSAFGLQAQDVFISNTENRTHTSLNGKWKYVLDPYETGAIGFMPLYKNTKPKDKSDRVEYSFDAAQSMYIPGSWNAQKPELQYYEGSIWFRKTFDKPDLSPDKRYFVYVGAANYLSTVTCNGTELGKHEGGFTPFAFEVTDLLQKKDNYIIIGVNNSRKADAIPAKVTDWFNHGGITRDVKLLEVPKTFVNNYYLSLDKNTLHERTKSIQGSLHLNGTEFPKEAIVEIPELKLKEHVAITADGTADFTLNTKKLSLWSPNNPKLYTVHITAGEDHITDQIGFRTIATRGREILLNGEPIFLRGISLHDENPLRKDRANSVADAELVLGWAEELGCNFIRLAHYPHQEHLVRLADEKGMLLWEELPLYWGIAWDNPAVLAKAKQQYTEMIQRDYNRASSIIWSVANETAPDDARNHFLTELANHIRSLDSTRLLSAACKKDQAIDGHPDKVYTYSDPIMEQLDIISFNEYLGWYGGAPEECRDKEFTTAFEKPIIVSEFGGGALAGFHADKETRWSEEFQEYLYEENIAMFDRIEGLAGMTPWILVDFQSPLRQLPDVQDGWNRKGVLSEKGYKKKAFYILQAYYEMKAKGE